MSSTTVEYPDVLLTGPREIKEAPAWIPEEFAPEIVSAKKIGRMKCLSKITIVRARGLESVLAHKNFLVQLATSFQKTPGPAKVVFVLNARRAATDPQRLLSVLKFFDRASDVEFVRGVKEAEFALTEALAKIWAEPSDCGEEDTRPDPLGSLKSVIASTKDLRSSSGRLSADRVAEAFGLSLNALASAISRTRQSLFKTPDSEAIQEKLFPFERVARLRALLSPEDFLVWLSMSNELLDGFPPISIIKRGEAPIVADLVEDMLTGSPT